MAFVRKRAGAWYVRYVDDSGQQVERVTKAATKTEAARIAEELERRAERVRLGLEHAVEEITVRAAYEQRFKPVIQGRAGFAAMDSRFRLHILPVLGERFVHQVRPADVRALLASRERPWQRKNPDTGATEQRKALSPQSREHVRVDLSSLFTYVIDDLKVFKGENPVRAVEKVRIPEKPPKYLELEEITAALAVVPDRWRGFIATAVYTGLRFSELRRLRVDEVDLARGMLTIWNTKSGKARYVPVADDLVPYLKVELGRARSEWLFPRQDGTQLTKDCGALRMFRRALRRAGVLVGFDHLCRSRGKGTGCGYRERRADGARSPCPKCGRQLEVVGVPKPFTIKDLRSTFGTHAAEQTGDLRAVQRALGHSSLAVTEKRYAFARDRHFRDQLSGLRLTTPARPLPADETEREPTREAERKVTRLPTAGKSREELRKANESNAERKDG